MVCRNVERLISYEGERSVQISRQQLCSWNSATDRQNQGRTPCSAENMMPPALNWRGSIKTAISTIPLTSSARLDCGLDAVFIRCRMSVLSASDDVVFALGLCCGNSSFGRTVVSSNVDIVVGLRLNVYITTQSSQKIYHEPTETLFNE